MMKNCDTFGLFAALLTVIFPQHMWAKLCSEVLSRDVIKEVEYKEPCIQKYTARCGWLSLNYCTFYHQTFCDRKKNDTVTTYYVVTHCCDGYYQAPNGSCLLLSVADVDHGKTTPRSPPYVFISNGGGNNSHKGEVQAVKHDPEAKEIKISTGGYAGIICGFAFICAVTFFIIRAIRKRHKRKPRKPPVPAKIECMVRALPPSPKNSLPEMVPLTSPAKVECIVTSLSSSPKKSLPEMMPLTSPISLSIAAKNNGNNHDEETCRPLSVDAIEVAESAGDNDDDITDVMVIPESNV